VERGLYNFGWFPDNFVQICLHIPLFCTKMENQSAHPAPLIPKRINRPSTHKRVAFTISVQNLEHYDDFCTKIGAKRGMAINFIIEEFFNNHSIIAI